MLPLGTKAPYFALPDGEGNTVRFSDASQARGFLVMFICNHCPYVKHLEAELTVLANHFVDQGGSVYAINSNDPAHDPSDGPERMLEQASAAGFRFPYLVDASQEVARQYQAACTPDFFLFDREKKLVYRGQFDESRPRNQLPVTGNDLAQAISCVLDDRLPPSDQKPSLGCNIKWVPGNEPHYFKGD